MDAEGNEELAKVAEALGVVRCCGTALAALAQYGANTREELAGMIDDFDALPDVYHRLAPEYTARLEHARELVAENAKVVDAILAFYRRALRTRPKAVQQQRCNCGCFEEEDDEEDDKKKKEQQQQHKEGKRARKETRKVSWEHQQMAQNIVMQLYREWGVEGAAERAECFAPVVAMCRKYAPAPAAETGGRARCMVPGAGLCRLAYEVAAALPHVDVLACEVSHAMLLPAQYLLGAHVPARTHTLYPFAHVTANVVHAATMPHAPVHVPDVCVDPQLLRRGRLALTSDDFVSFCHAQPRAGSFDLLATCFFVDTAYNILDYIQAAARLLRPGAYWVNSGPLHWVHHPRESVRLTVDEIVAAMETAGFVFVEPPTVLPYRHYCSPPGSLMPMVFDCCLWVAQLTE